MHTRIMKDKKTKVERVQSALERMAFRTAQSIGSPVSLVLHTIFFVGVFSLRWFGFNIEQILLLLTTAVSLEAIYLAIFIQMTVNKQAEDIEDIQEDVDEISEDIEDIQEDVEEISDEMSEDEKEEERLRLHSNDKLQKIEDTLHRLLSDIDGLKK